MSLLEAVFLVVIVSFIQILCCRTVARFIAGCPVDERTWINRTKFRRAVLISGGLLTWLGLTAWAIGWVIRDEGSVHYDNLYDEDDYSYY